MALGSQRTSSPLINQHPNTLLHHLWQSQCPAFLDEISINIGKIIDKFLKIRFQMNLPDDIPHDIYLLSPVKESNATDNPLFKYNMPTLSSRLSETERVCACACAMQAGEWMVVFCKRFQILPDRNEHRAANRPLHRTKVIQTIKTHKQYKIC